MHNVKRRELTEAELTIVKEKIRKYKQLTDLLLSERISLLSKEEDIESYNEDKINILLTTTMKLLTINPNIATIWNFRRDLVAYLIKKRDDNIKKSELDIIEKCLNNEPKGYILWLYRQWLVDTEYEEINKGESEKKQELFEREMDLVVEFINEDNRNFHAWNYRRWICKKFFKNSVSSIKYEKNDEGEVESEEDNLDDNDDLIYTKECIESDFSNYSAWHQRYLSVKKMYEESDENTKRKIKEEEIEFVSSCLMISPSDESLWLYLSLISDAKEDIETMKEILKDEKSNNGIIRAVSHIIDFEIKEEKEYALDLLNYAIESNETNGVFKWLKFEIEKL